MERRSMRACNDSIARSGRPGTIGADLLDERELAGPALDVPPFLRERVQSVRARIRVREVGVLPDEERVDQVGNVS